jgi:two-component system cell cycle sensor histidine kinase/response regulator CckA
VNQYRQGRDHAKISSDCPDLEFTTRLDPHLLNIIGSPGHLEKTISHLVANAAGAVLNAGLIRISTENVHLETPLPGAAEIPPGDYVTLTVADSGRPLEPEQRERIFEPFYTNKVLGRNDTGLGLGFVWVT